MNREMTIAHLLGLLYLPFLVIAHRIPISCTYSLRDHKEPSPPIFSFQSLNSLNGYCSYLMERWHGHLYFHVKEKMGMGYCHLPHYCLPIRQFNPIPWVHLSVEIATFPLNPLTRDGSDDNRVSIDASSWTLLVGIYKNACSLSVSGYTPHDASPSPQFLLSITLVTWQIVFLSIQRCHFHFKWNNVTCHFQ